MIEEQLYRQLVDEAFGRIDAAFEKVDPDLAEAYLSQGTLTIVYQGAKRFIISPQPPVRQIWAAFKDRAWHFDRDQATGRWLDDRGHNVDLFALVEQITRETIGQEIAVAASP